MNEDKVLSPRPPAVEIKNATLKIEGNIVLKDFSCTIGAGEQWFVMGPNGAGKTSFVKMTLGLLWPLWGASVRVLGGKYGECDIIALRKKVAWVSPFLNSWAADALYNRRWTALEIALSGLDSSVGFFRVPSDAEKEMAMTALENIGAGKLADRYFDRLSSGEQVKVLIARAMICSPELVILDEPCVYLDLTGREILLSAIDEIAGRKNAPAMLFVTQRIEEITNSFTKGMLVKDGRVFVSGDRDAVLTEKNLSDVFDLNIKLDGTPDGRLWPVITRRK